MALAGPAVNVVIAAAFFVFLQFSDAWAPLEQLSVAGGPFLQRLMVVNVMLVVFNMLPAFPMDGKRVLRALLATRIEYTRATHIAANIGQGMALMFGFLGFFKDFLLCDRTVEFGPAARMSGTFTLDDVPTNLRLVPAGTGAGLAPCMSNAAHAIHVRRKRDRGASRSKTPLEIGLSRNERADEHKSWVGETGHLQDLLHGKPLIAKWGTQAPPGDNEPFWWCA